MSMEVLLARSDILTMHTSYSPATRRLVAAAEFAKIKPGILLIHATRGGVVDAEELLATL